MEQELLKIALRQKALYIPGEYKTDNAKKLNSTTAVFVANVAKLGFTFTEPLLHRVNELVPKQKLTLLNILKDVTGMNKNWTPLVKGWDEPTGESRFDHIVTFFANVFKYKKGTQLQCGHVIPEGTFPLERYNGCPYCGTPFEQGEIEVTGQGSKLKVLDLWGDAQLQEYLISLLQSKTALDATQATSLKTLLQFFDLPEGVEIGIKETMILVIDAFVENKSSQKASALFKSPQDILRYLWYKKTGYLQVVAPKTIIERGAKNHEHLFSLMDKSSVAEKAIRKQLKLKYNRSECRMVAEWMNALPVSAEQACEMMHPKRGMWVRFIRALRLAEYSKRKGFEKLAEILDFFYNGVYECWNGAVNKARINCDAETTFELLKQRPGVFARSLFSNMLWFGSDETIKHFGEVTDKIPARLLLTLNMYAGYYFSKTGTRTVKPLGGVNKRISQNALLDLYDEKKLDAMKAQIEQLCYDAMVYRFAGIENENKTMYINRNLFNMPLAIGDRSETVQDLPSALMGTRFPVEGNAVRLFMQWGTGLSAQHLDMDLSCVIAYENKLDRCSYSWLTTTGCKHSGDIQHIPNKVGTAEYIEINIDELTKHGAKYVSFACNAYSCGSISPNLVVGWMNSKHPMKISNKSGVAYDPSCVQHQVRVTQSLTKGLVFGVLDVMAREIIWFEQAFDGQIVQNLDMKNVEAMIAKLDSKLSIGNLLLLKAEAQDLELVEDESLADEVYDMQWAIDSAAVTQMFVD